MAVQTSYSFDPAARIPGREATTYRVQKRSGINKLSAEAIAGVALAQSSSQDDGMVALAAATDKIAGVVLNDYSRNPSGLTTANGAYADGTAMPMAVEGPIFVRIDQNVKPGDPVYVRFAASNGSSTGAVGSFRKDADGVAQVSTVTPTAANSTIYVLRVKFSDESYTFEYVSDGSATATEICNGFRTVMAADLAFTARVVATGTSTLILTGQVAGEVFAVQAEGDGAMSVAATTPPAPTARLLKGARWCSSGTATAGVGELDFSVKHDYV